MVRGDPVCRKEDCSQYDPGLVLRKTMVGEMVYIHSHHVIVIHEYIYSHLTTKFTFKEYIYSHLPVYFPFIDYEQSLFFLSPSDKTRENAHARDCFLHCALTN